MKCFFKSFFGTQSDTLPSKLFLISFFVMACSGTNLSDTVVINSGGSGGSTNDEPAQDTEAPVLTGVISLSSDSQTDRSPTAVWLEGTDNVAITKYEFSISEDSGNNLCGAEDFSSPLVGWTPLPSGTDFSGAGVQIVNGGLDGDGQLINLNLKGNKSYCMTVRALDSAGNISNVLYSSSVSNFYYQSCNQAKTNEPSLTDGIYTIDPDGPAGDNDYDVFCDMTTQGGGWTLVIRYDASQANAGAFFLPAGAGRSMINPPDLKNINTTGNLAASANMIPFIENGATTLMHIGKPHDGATDSSTYVHVYFSDIYQSVINNPSNIFDVSFDTNTGDGVSGAIVNGTTTVRKDQWYDSNMAVMTVWDTDGDSSNSYRIDGGEGMAMFTNGNREGALYCSGSTSNVSGHGDPKVQWGFEGKDGSSQSYSGSIHVGTHCKSNLSCGPTEDINMMFIR